MNGNQKIDMPGEVQHLTTNAFYSLSKQFTVHPEYQLSTTMNELEASCQDLETPISRKEYFDWFGGAIHFEKKEKAARKRQTYEYETSL